MYSIMSVIVCLAWFRALQMGLNSPLTFLFLLSGIIIFVAQFWTNESPGQIQQWLGSKKNKISAILYTPKEKNNLVPTKITAKF